MMKSLRFYSFLAGFLALVAFAFVAVDASSSMPYTDGADAPELNYVFRQAWGIENLPLSYPNNVAVARDKTLYVADGYDNILIAISPAENTTRILWDGGMVHETCADSGYNLTGLALDDQGNIYIIDKQNCALLKLDKDGEELGRWGHGGSGAGEFWEPHGIAVHGSIVYVADSGNNRIQAFDLNGNYLYQWGAAGTAAGEFYGPVGIAVDELGNVYVTDAGNQRVQKFDSAGGYLSHWATSDGSSYPEAISISANGTVYVVVPNGRYVRIFDTSGVTLGQWGAPGSGDEEFVYPRGIALDSSGDVYVADEGGKRVQKFDATGDFRRQWQWQPTGAGRFIHAEGIAVSRSGDVYVADSYGNQIHRFNNRGTIIDVWGSKGSGDGQFNYNGAVAVDNNGNVYVLDFNDRRIQKFSKEGQFIRAWGGLGQLDYAYGIAVGNNRLYVPDSGDVGNENGGIHVFSTEGQFLEWIDIAPYGYPSDIAIDAAGNLYVSYSRYQEYEGVLKLDPNGAYLLRWGESGNGPGQFNGISGIAVDDRGLVFVADGNSRVQVFDENGLFLTQWGRLGTAEGEFRGLAGIAVDPQGRVYVTDTENGRVQVFTNGFPASDPSSGLVLDGSFEASPAHMEWTSGGDLPIQQVSQAIHGGFSLRLGDVVPRREQGVSQAWVNQTIYIEPTWLRPQLSFKYRLFVNDILDYSDFIVAIQDSMGRNHLATVWRDGYRPCTPGVPPAPATDLGWRSAAYDLSAFKGQHIRIVFSNRNLWPESWGIWSLVDDVRVLDAGSQDTPPGAERVYLPAVQNMRCDAVPIRNLETR